MLTITLPTVPLSVEPTADYLATVYVVNWEPTSVGGFEWRATRDEAEAFRREIEDPTARVYVVAIPPEIGSDAWAISEWLDDEGWSDGIDPRILTARREPSDQRRGLTGVHQAPTDTRSTHR